MRKPLIALAALAAASTAMAQSSVTLFGVLDTSIAYVRGDGAGNRNYGLLNNGIAVSRLGFRGVEDFGNGLKAGFWLEGAVSPDDGAGFDFKRRSSLSLMGNFGELRLGRFLTAGHDKPSNYSVFGTIGVGGFQGWALEAVRYDNMLAYYTPNWSGLSLGVNYAFDEQGSNANFHRGRYIGIEASYANGPFSITLAADQADDAAATTSKIGYPAYDVNGNAISLGTDKIRSYSLGASYDFGSLKLNGLAHQARIHDVQGTSFAGDYKYNAYALGISAAVSASGVLKAQYAHYKIDAAKANQLSLGYEHNLSKRTAFYGTYSYLKNNKNGRWVVGGDSSLKVQGIEDKASHGIQLGVRHAF